MKILAKQRTLLMALAAISAAGCATTRRAGSGEDDFQPPPWVRDSPGPRPRQEGAPPEEVSGGLPRRDTRTIPGGPACLIRLRELGVPHEGLGSLRGVVTPVRVTGPIGGIRLVSMGRRGMDCDCRLAVALHRAAPYLQALGVTELHFSSAYRHSRIAGTRTMSRHAYGLAVDIHRVVAGGERLLVEDDFERGHEASCTGAFPLLNRLACVLKSRGLFDRVLTPDTDQAHHNHFHLAILSLHRRRRVPRDTPPEASAE